LAVEQPSDVVPDEASDPAAFVLVLIAIPMKCPGQDLRQPFRDQAKFNEHQLYLADVEKYEQRIGGHSDSGREWVAQLSKLITET
jgi:hypothetical protein